MTQECADDCDTGKTRARHSHSEYVTGHLGTQPKSELAPDINEEVRKLLPVQSGHTTVEEIELHYERGNSRPSESRVRIVDGGKTIKIEDFALRRFAELGYAGFHGENRFWELFDSFLFYEFMLRTIQAEEGVFYSLPWPRAPGKTDQDQYLGVLKQLKEMRDLKKHVHERVAHYLLIPLCIKVEKKRRSSDRFRNSLGWFDIIIDSIERNTLLRIVDWTIRFPGKQLRGMPDLFLCKNHRVSFAEIKSERDKLRDEQARTLLFLTSELGLDVFLVKGIQLPRVTNVAGEEMPLKP